MNVIVMMVLFYAAPNLRGSCAFWGCSAGTVWWKILSGFRNRTFFKTQVYLETGNHPMSNVL